MLRSILFFTLAIAMSLAAIFAYAHEKGYEYTIPQTTVPPKIDGDLDDIIWQKAKYVIVKLINTGGEVKKEYYTNAWAVYDANNIYVAFLNSEPNPKSLLTNTKNRDGNSWEDDENEIFIEPLHNGSKPYFQFCINAANVVYDAESGGAEVAWNCKNLKSATKVGKDNWALEVLIPFESLNVKKIPPIGETWGWNFNRHIRSGGADIWTGWSETGSSFHTPNRFGDLTFGKEVMAVCPTGKLTTCWGEVKRSY